MGPNDGRFLTDHLEQVSVVIEISGLGFFYPTKTSTFSDTSGIKRLFNANEKARGSVGQNQALHGLGPDGVRRRGRASKFGLQAQFPAPRSQGRL